MAKLILTISSETHHGKKREVNEDTAFCFQIEELMSSPVETLAVIGAARGMGGPGAGDAASRAARGFIEDAFLKRGTIQIGHHDGLSRGDYTLLLTEIFDECNRTILQLAASAHTRGQTGTTLALGVIAYHPRDDKTYLHVGNVGNSRGYILRGDQIFHATEEDSVAWRMYKKGEITYSEMLTHPKRSVITVMGMNEVISPEVHSIELHADDVVLFCTEGVHEVVDDAQIDRVIRKSAEVKKACQSLIAAAASASRGTENSAAALAVLSLPAAAPSTHPASRVRRRVGAGMTLKKKSIVALWSAVLILLIATVAVYFHTPGTRLIVQGSFSQPEMVKSSRDSAAANRGTVLPLEPKKDIEPKKATARADSLPPAGGKIEVPKRIPPPVERKAAAVKHPQSLNAHMSVEWNPETERFRIQAADPSVVPVRLRYEMYTFDVIPVKSMPNLYRTTRGLKSSFFTSSKTVLVTVAHSSRSIPVAFTQTK